MNLDKYQYKVTIDGTKGGGTCRSISDLVQIINQFGKKGIHIKIEKQDNWRKCNG